MYNQSELHLKRSTVSLCVATALGIATPGYIFAEETEEEDTEATSEETITVTGTRIPLDPNVTSSVPVQSLSANDIKMSGELNLADIVNDIPALVSSLTAEQSATGSNSLNLRGLGGTRTLTLVNGRRHVAGFRGSSAVDIGTIPRALVERVEVTTGGASAVYGADAVTGVVNFILKDNFEGFKLDVQAGLPEQSGGENYGFDAAYGINFDDDKGNVVFTLTSEVEDDLLWQDRTWSINNGRTAGLNIARPENIPAGFFNGPIPSRALFPDPRYWLTSHEGSIAPGFGGRDVTYVDINGNGIPDCQESEGGRVGFLAGCWITNPDGSVRVQQNGIVLGSLWESGGDGAAPNQNRDTLMPATEKKVFNMNFNYEFTDDMRFFFEGKYVEATSETFAEYDTYYDTLFILPDNPFIPAQLQSVANQVGYLLLTQDPLDFADNDPSIYTRETTRVVAGLEWDIDVNHSIEFSINKGTFKNTSEYTNFPLDRVFAAMDVTTDANGNPVCRSDLDPNAFYEIDYFSALNGFANGNFFSNRYYTFTPGDGQCQPLNPFGRYSVSPEAQNFITARLMDELTIEQTVFSVFANGEFDFADDWLDGPIGYAAGVEYREESSDNRLDPLNKGILPQGSSFTSSVGQLASTVDPWINSFWLDNVQNFDSGGEYDVFDTFLEVRVPILEGRDFAKELSVDAAVRVADYSTLGETTTWKFGLAWAPNDDISFRATVSEAVRAPNITELFDPRLPITINLDSDPCDPGNINDGTANRQPNCVADLLAAGVPQSDILDSNGNYIWVNPLTARFTGVSGGNPNLNVETADTVTFGTVITPEAIEGLVFTIDYWDVVIDDAISPVGASDILDGCFDSGSYPDFNFCSQFTRRSDGGLDFLETGQINFAKQEAEGIDVSVSYTFEVDADQFGITLVGTRQDKLDNFFNPLDLTEVNPELEEASRGTPKTSGNLTLSWGRDNINVALQTSYMSRQAIGEIEQALGLYGNDRIWGDDAFFDAVYIHDLNVNYQYDDNLTIYGGINNLADEEPFSNQTAWPVGPRGRMLFLGASYTL
jgi:iron complex outermembrane receptor protein